MPKIDGLKKAAEEAAVMSELNEAIFLARRIDRDMRAAFVEAGAKRTTLACAYLAGWWASNSPYDASEVQQSVGMFAKAGVLFARGEIDEIRLEKGGTVAIRLQEDNSAARGNESPEDRG